MYLKHLEYCIYRLLKSSIKKFMLLCVNEYRQFCVFQRADDQKDDELLGSTKEGESYEEEEYWVKDVRS